MKRIYLLLSVSLSFTMSGQKQNYPPAFLYETDSDNIKNVVGSTIKSTSTFESFVKGYNSFADLSESKAGTGTFISAKRSSGISQNDIMLSTYTVSADSDAGITGKRVLKNTNLENDVDQNSPISIASAFQQVQSDQAGDDTVTMVKNNTDFPAPYCDASAVSLLTVSEISKVEFAGSSRNSNLDGSSPVIENFTDIIFDVNKGNSYPISVTGGTHGQATVSVYAYIDLNHNHLFDDNEKFNLGYLDNSNPVPGQQSGKVSGVISIPNDALTGETRFRLVKAYESVSWIGHLENSPCPVGWFIGQVEDYTINIQPSSLSVNEIKKGSAKIYPNPTQGSIHMITDDHFEKFELYTITGRKVLEGTSSTADLTDFEPGAYIAKIYTVNQKITTVKIIKK